MDDCLNSLLCIGWILMTLLIEKLKLVVMGEIGSRHLSFTNCRASVFLAAPFGTLLGFRLSAVLSSRHAALSHPFSFSDSSRDHVASQSTAPRFSPAKQSCRQERV